MANTVCININKIKKYRRKVNSIAARPPALDSPPTPALRLEPTADCGRYDSLRGVRNVH